MTVFPYARSPYGKIVLYTPMFSSTFTTPSGVQGRMDFTNPGGGASLLELRAGALATDGGAFSVLGSR